MSALIHHKGLLAPLLKDNIDTDQIIPSREMKSVSKTGLAGGLFAGQRYKYEGKKKLGLAPDFVLNQPQYGGATVLLCGKNFGCGSSREHAVWALKEYGFKAIIAESFSNIFRNNCVRNHLLPITLNAEQIKTIAVHAELGPFSVTIDVEALRLQVDNALDVVFELDSEIQAMLLNGWDVIDITLQKSAEINAFIAKDKSKRPWAYLKDA